MTEYYFQDQLRWSFGFDNPNKTAALLVTLLPLLWLVAALGWRMKGRVLRIAMVAVGSLALLAGWWLLVMTYSRGGLVAGCLAFAYLGWQRRVLWTRHAGRVALVLSMAALVGVLCLKTGAAKRSTQWVGAREGSVENRFELWKGGLRMFAEIPQGVGRGQSGEFYMQWFQPLESSARYRTMVNSYLTFLTEQGWWRSGIVLFIALLSWRLTAISTGNPVKDDIAHGLRAVWVAFAVAGFFSTTMESSWLWIAPGLSAVVLLWLAGMRKRQQGPWLTVVLASGLAICIAAGTWFAGWWLAHGEPCRVARSGDVITLRPACGAAKVLGVLPDEAVLGMDQGKLLRRLSIGSGANVRVCSERSSVVDLHEPLLLAGDAVSKCPARHDGVLILVAPAKMDPDSARRLVEESSRVLLLSPSFDEDGRGAFWDDVTAGGAASQHVTRQTLNGVGNQVEWAWEQVVEAVSKEVVDAPNPIRR